MADVFSVLAADHDRIFALSNRLTGASSVPPDKPKERKAIADQLVTELSRHEVVYEQNIVWPKLRLRLSDAEAQSLGAEIERAKRLAPTRPHPHVPPNPSLLKKLAPAAAMLDRARNALIRRPA